MPKSSRMSLWGPGNRTRIIPEQKPTATPDSPEPVSTSGKPTASRQPPRRFSRPTDPTPPPRPSPPRALEAGDWRSASAPDDGPSYRGKRLPRKKARRCTLTLSCSREEASILRKAAKESGKSFSSWARLALFAAAGQPLPDRQDPG